MLTKLDTDESKKYRINTLLNLKVVSTIGVKSKCFRNNINNMI